MISFTKRTRTWPKFLDLQRQLAKLFRQFVARLDLQLRELPGLLTGQYRNQSLKFDCRFVGLIGFFFHQSFKFSD